MAKTGKKAPSAKDVERAEIAKAANAEAAAAIREVADRIEGSHDLSGVLSAIADVVQNGDFAKLPLKWLRDHSLTTTPKTIRVIANPHAPPVPFIPSDIEGSSDGRPMSRDTRTARWLLRIAADPTQMRWVGYGAWAGPAPTAEKNAELFAYAAAAILTKYHEVHADRDALANAIFEEMKETRAAKQRVVRALEIAGFPKKNAHDIADHAEKAERKRNM